MQEIVYISAEDLLICAKQEKKELLFENTGITLYCDEGWTVEAIGNLLKMGLTIRNEAAQSVFRGVFLLPC